MEAISDLSNALIRVSNRELSKIRHNHCGLLDDRGFGQRIDDACGDHNDKLDDGVIRILGTEELAEDGDIRDAGDAGERVGGAMVEDAGDYEAFSVANLNFCVRAAGG